MEQEHCAVLPHCGAGHRGLYAIVTSKNEMEILRRLDGQLPMLLRNHFGEDADVCFTSKYDCVYTCPRVRGVVLTPFIEDHRDITPFECHHLYRTLKVPVNTLDILAYFQSQAGLQVGK